MIRYRFLRVLSLILVILGLVCGSAFAAGIRIVPSTTRVMPGEDFFFDVVAEGIPAAGLGGVQFRLNITPTSGNVSGVSDLSQAGVSDIAVVTPLLVSPAISGRSGVGDFFWNGKGPNGILTMDNETLTNGSALFTFAHTSGSTPPSGSGSVARFAVRIGSGVKAERLDISLGDVMLLDGGPAYTLDYANGASVQLPSKPGSPTGVTAMAGDAQATVTFSAPASDGGSIITGYTVTSSPGSITASGTSSPITVTGLTNGQAYTFTVIATNAIGSSAASDQSNSVTPVLATKTDQSIGAITFAPDTVTVGGTTTVNATASSGLAVVFSSLTPDVCTVNGSTVTAISAGDCIVSANQAGNNTYNPAPQATQSITVAAASHSIIVTINGHGSVTSNPQSNNAIACTNGSGECSASFPHGTPIALTATPTTVSIFSGWSGACSGTASTCNLTLDVDKVVTANFKNLQPLQISGTQLGYDSLAHAYAAMADNSTVTLLGLAITLPDSGFTLNKPVTLIIKGGYDENFSAKQDVTVIQGPLTVSFGALTVEDVVIR